MVDSPTGRADRRAFQRWRLAPRLASGLVERDLSTGLLGTRLPAPVLLAAPGPVTG